MKLDKKFFEVRDRGTLLPVMCIKISPNLSFHREIYFKEEKIVSRAGFDLGQTNLLYVKLETMQCHYDNFSWNDRTNHTAHTFIIENWYSLSGGEVIDVEHILKETKEKKVSEIN